MYFKRVVLIRKLIIVVAILLAFSCGIFAAACVAFRVPNQYRMAKHPAKVDGRVTEQQPKNHMRVGYSFAVGNQSYTGVGGVGDAFDTIRVGDKVSVKYDPLD